MHPNRPLLGIIFQSCAIICIHYGLKSTLVVDSPILCFVNGPYWPLLNISLYCEYNMSESPCIYWALFIASNRPQSDISYSYKLALECPIIYIVSLRISTLMSYYFYHKSSICHLNARLYSKVSQMLLGVLLLRN